MKKIFLNPAYFLLKGKISYSFHLLGPVPKIFYRLPPGKTILPAGGFDKINNASIDIHDKIIKFLNFLNYFELEIGLQNVNMFICKF